MAADALIRKLEQFTQLSDEDKRLLGDAAKDVRNYGRRQDVIQQGDKPQHVHLVVEGWAARYKVLPDGDMPIMAFLIPGDFCDVRVTLLDVMDHGIKALSPCKIAHIPKDAISNILYRGDGLARALWWTTLVDEAILREWLVNMGHREAEQRIGHLICEMLLRSKAVGLTEDDSYEMPLTQDELGETMGLSSVHINRSMQALRSQDLIITTGKRMVVSDLDGLMAFSEFDATYLHQMNKRDRHGQGGSQ